MRRTLEPEVMDSDEEARDYDAMDHAEVNRRFVADLLAELPRAGATVLDVGCGTALIPVELARRSAGAVIAVDAACAMLELGRENIARAGLASRIRLCRGDARRLPFADRSFAVVISNSLLHHLPEPGPVLAELARVCAAGGLIFARDLFRPADEAELGRLLEAHASGATARQRALLADSLRAALTIEELRALVAGLGLPPGGVRATSDRHWTWVARPA